LLHLVDGEDLGSPTNDADLVDFLHGVLANPVTAPGEIEHGRQAAHVAGAGRLGLFPTGKPVQDVAHLDINDLG
jgi:hypothetical protein